VTSVTHKNASGTSEMWAGHEADASSAYECLSCHDDRQLTTISGLPGTLTSTVR